MEGEDKRNGYERAPKREKGKLLVLKYFKRLKLLERLQATNHPK